MKPFVGSIWNTQKKLPRKVVGPFSSQTPSSSGEITEASLLEEFNWWIPTIRAPLNQLSYVINMFKKKNMVKHQNEVHKYLRGENPGPWNEQSVEWVKTLENWLVGVDDGFLLPVFFGKKKGWNQMIT